MKSKPISEMEISLLPLEAMMWKERWYSLIHLIMMGLIQNTTIFSGEGV